MRVSSWGLGAGRRVDVDGLAIADDEASAVSVFEPQVVDTTGDSALDPRVEQPLEGGEEDAPRSKA